MRRLSLLLFVTLAMATVCLGQAAPTNQPGSPHIKPPTATTGASAKGKSSIEDMLIAREKEVWELIKKKDVQGFSAYLADEQLYVSNDGVHSKAETGKGIAEGSLSELTLDEWRVVMINKDTALVSYRAAAKGMVKGQESSGVSRESTVWARRGGKWLAVFHQTTPVESAK
jgi:hypothetical protein